MAAFGRLLLLGPEAAQSAPHMHVLVRIGSDVWQFNRWDSLR